MAGLGKVVPSLVMMRTGVFTQPFLRGVGKRSNLGVENSVATYVDGVYSRFADQRAARPARHRAGRGPERAAGNLVRAQHDGRRHPDRHAGPKRRSRRAKCTLAAGTYGYFRGDATDRGERTDRGQPRREPVATRRLRDEHSTPAKTDQGEVDHSLVARSKWIWRPDAALKLTLAGDYQDIDRISSPPVPGFPAVGQPPSKAFTTATRIRPNRFRFRYGGVSLRADAEIGSLTFMSLSALRRMDARWSLDLDTGPQPLSGRAFRSPSRTRFSQEFQLQSDEASRVRWVAGLDYIRIEEQYDPTMSHYGGSYSAPLGGSAPADPVRQRNRVVLRRLWPRRQCRSCRRLG